VASARPGARRRVADALCRGSPIGGSAHHEEYGVPYELAPFADINLTEPLLRLLIEEHEETTLPACDRLLAYFRNDDKPTPGRDGAVDWRPAQIAGLPDRLTRPIDGGSPKELVIENDIGWRVQTIVDYVAGRDVAFVSRARDEPLAKMVGEVVEAMFESNGGAGLIQEAVLLGAIYGHVDFVLRIDDLPRREAKAQSGLEALLEVVRSFRIEVIERPRAFALLNPTDYRRIDALVIHHERWLNDVEDGGFLSRLGSWITRTRVDVPPRRATTTVTEILSATHRQVYEDEHLVLSEPNALGFVPAVHVQHQRRPFEYAGLGEVEPLIALQDELNTRLSDRANRVTLQSFKMYLGRGIEGFGDRPVGPGQMWITENPDASIQAFGGDAESPSEENHIREVREALDKISAVTPLAAGLIRAKVGTLSSENAMRISLLGILSKTLRLRQLYGRGLSTLSSMALAALDQTGWLRTEQCDRCIEPLWAPPIPQDESRVLADALVKRDLGVPSEVILSELGYGDRPAQPHMGR